MRAHTHTIGDLPGYMPKFGYMPNKRLVRGEPILTGMILEHVLHMSVY